MTRESRSPGSKAHRKEELVNELPIAARLRADFPDELEALFKLPPLRALMYDREFLAGLAKVIYGHRPLGDTRTKRALSSAIRSADEAADAIEIVKRGIQELDSERLRDVLKLANRLFLPYYPETPAEFVELLRHFQAMFSILSLALAIGTGLFQIPQKKGRPTAASEHVLAAIELIQLWEHVTAEKLPEYSQIRAIRAVPTPKKDAGIIGQPSTEFVRLAFQMINPGITDSKVFTAIKHALQTQREFYELLSRDADLAKTMGAIFRMNERASLVRKIAPKPTS